MIKYGQVSKIRWTNCLHYKTLVGFTRFREKKRLGLQRNQIFKQGSFLGGRGSAKLFGELCVPLKKTWLRPWLDCMS